MADKQSHHLVPRELFGNPTIKSFLDTIGIGMEDAKNKMDLPTKDNAPGSGFAAHN